MLRTMPHRRSATALRRVAEGESERTILIALFANMVIAVAKLAGGLVSGSTGMLAEAAHSAADSVNEIFLAVGFYRARQPADARHPLGHGRERFLWSFMAAIASSRSPSPLGTILGGALPTISAGNVLKAWLEGRCQNTQKA